MRPTRASKSTQDRWTLCCLGIHISEEALADLTVEIGIEHGLDLHEFTRLYERLKDADGPGDEKSLREV